MASAVIGYNEDLLSEIFSRLPLKPFCRFSCVSKLCNSIFIRFRHHVSRETCKRVSGLFAYRPKYCRSHGGCYTPVMTEYDIIPLHEFGMVAKSSFKYANSEPLKIIQSCNGLLFCRTCDSETRMFNFYVCNPTTLQFKKLPDPIYTKFWRNDSLVSVGGVALAFDPRKSPHYKVLCVYYCTSRYYNQMEMYSSETGQWRLVHDPFPADLSLSSAVYWNGAINWLPFYTGDGSYFNVDEERFGKLPMLPRTDSQELREILYFGESSDHLHLVESYDGSAKQLNIYEMDKEYSGWFIKYQIDNEVVSDAYILLKPLSYKKIFSVLSVVYGGIGEDPYVVLLVEHPYVEHGTGAIRYNLVNKSHERISYIIGSNMKDLVVGCYSWRYSFQYIESICEV